MTSSRRARLPGSCRLCLWTMKLWSLARSLLAAAFATRNSLRWHRGGGWRAPWAPFSNSLRRVILTESRVARLDFKHVGFSSAARASINACMLLLRFACSRR